MALTSTLYSFDVTLADSDRNVYEAFKCQLARHPSETLDFLTTRLLAYCLEYEDGLKFSRGLSEPDEPAIWLKGFDGEITSWIEVGLPDPVRLHKAAKIARRVAVYAHRSPVSLMKQLEAKRIHRGESIPIYSFDSQFIQNVGAAFDRRTAVSVSVSGEQLYVELGGTSHSAPVLVQYPAPEVS